MFASSPHVSRIGLLARFVLPLLISGLVFSLVAAQFSPFSKFDREDEIAPVPPDSIVFTGASSIAFWDSLADDMKPLHVVNRGIPGTHYTDMIRYADRLVIRYRPRAVVVYAGDNDLTRPTRKTPESVLNDLRQYIDLIHTELPDTWVYVISIKPSHARWDSWQQMREADQLIADYLGTRERTQFIDVASAMLDAKGDLPRDLFVSDGLHPSAKCYKLWTSIIKPVLLARFGDAADPTLETTPTSTPDATPSTPDTTSQPPAAAEPGTPLTAR
jgi:lysophospholipase L1-like esterase